MARKVLLTTPKFLEFESFVQEYLRDNNCELVEHQQHRVMNEAILRQIIGPANGLVTGLEPVTESVFAAAPDLKVVSAGGVGHDHIDLEAASRHGVAVCICAGCNNHSVAELAFGLLLGLARQLYTADRAIRAGEWTRVTGPELWGKTIGIVGLGRVGKSVALLARGFGMRVLATDVVWDITFANEHQLSYVPLPRLLAEADVVSLHCPLTSRTRKLIDEQALARMKPTAYLINTARGPIVDEPALVHALRSGKIAGAGLDVFETEPRENNPYTEFSNVLLTTHIGGASNEAVVRSLELALMNVTAVLDGRPPVCQVN